MPRKSNRREIIIDVATTRFLVRGYDLVTVDELCELTTSTKGSFYHFFTNKEALAVDVVNHVWHETQSQMTEIFSSDLSPRQQLHMEIQRITASHQRIDGKRFFVGCPVGTLAVSLRGKSLRLTRRLNFALNHMRQFYLAAFEEGIKSGDIEKTGTAAEMSDRFHLNIQGLSTLGKAYSGPRVRELSRQITIS